MKRSLDRINMPDDKLTTADIQADPLVLARSFQLSSGLTVTSRPLLSSDGRGLGEYFAGLSAETRSRFGPHPLDQTTADQLCASIDYSQALRMVAVSPGPTNGQVIAYLILLLHVTDDELARYASLGIALDSTTDCTLAPSVADAYQNVGLGSLLLEHLLEVALRLGRKRMVLMGGTQATNHRAIRYYEKHGFQRVGTFEYPAGVLNHDMLLAP